jgi:hypothetical protein
LGLFLLRIDPWVGFVCSLLRLTYLLRTLTVINPLSADKRTILACAPWLLRNSAAGPLPARAAACHGAEIMKRYYFARRCAKTTFWSIAARIQFALFVFRSDAYGKMDEKLIACFAIGNRRDIGAYGRMRPTYQRRAVFLRISPRKEEKI